MVFEHGLFSKSHFPKKIAFQKGHFLILKIVELIEIDAGRGQKS
jgi:hypothetical protein